MVSYDVISFFTNIPVSETIEHILNVIPDNKIFISKPVLKELLHLACRNIVFKFNKEIYLQTEGMCMGSNLGPTMAAFAMNIIESKLTTQPLAYKRYVDDIFAIFASKEEADDFFEKLNSPHSELKFTQENETNESLIFLDVNVIKVNGKIETKWHRKNTNTGIYLNKTACSPMNYKTASIRSLIFRAFKICSTTKLFNDCFNEIMSIFILNGFNLKFIKKIRDQVISKL